MNLEFAAGRSAAQADSALRHALATEEKARRCAVLWFAEILERELYRDLGRSSMQQYARIDLGFSETRTGDFMHLARKLGRLPAVKAALPEIGYTKAREIVKVASPRTEDAWVHRARRQGRRDLAVQVKRALNRARKPAASLFDPDQHGSGSCGDPGGATGTCSYGGPGDPGGVDRRDAGPVPPIEEVPVRVSLEFTPEQFARWEALLAGLARQGVTGDRAAVLLDALAGRLEEEIRERTASTIEGASTNSEETARRRAVPRFQVHVHRCPDCRRTETAGGRLVGEADIGRISCDAAVSRPGERNTTTIPPRIRREVLARDRHHCTAPACHRTRFLEVHHVVPRRRGGTNHPDNLVTLCGACHRLWHEKGIRPGDGEVSGRSDLPKARLEAEGGTGDGTGEGSGKRTSDRTGEGTREGGT